MERKGKSHIEIDRDEMTIFSIIGENRILKLRR
jgi:hypothetical protein